MGTTGIIRHVRLMSDLSERHRGAARNARTAFGARVFSLEEMDLDTTQAQAQRRNILSEIGRRLPKLAIAGRFEERRILLAKFAAAQAL